jgi:hypothetical protein
MKEDRVKFRTGKIKHLRVPDGSTSYRVYTAGNVNGLLDYSWESGQGF